MTSCLPRFEEKEQRYALRTGAGIEYTGRFLSWDNALVSLLWLTHMGEKLKRNIELNGMIFGMGWANAGSTTTED